MGAWLFLRLYDMYTYACRPASKYIALDETTCWGRVVDFARQRIFHGALKKSPKKTGHKTELERRQTYVWYKRNKQQGAHVICRMTRLQWLKSQHDNQAGRWVNGFSAVMWLYRFQGNVWVPWNSSPRSKCDNWFLEPEVAYRNSKQVVGSTAWGGVQKTFPN